MSLLRILKNPVVTYVGIPSDTSHTVWVHHALQKQNRASFPFSLIPVFLLHLCICILYIVMCIVYVMDLFLD